jgi:hypothetical protein
MNKIKPGYYIDNRPSCGDIVRVICGDIVNGNSIKVEVIKDPMGWWKRKFEGIGSLSYNGLINYYTYLPGYGTPLYKLLNEG